MVICESCNGAGMVNGSKGASSVDKQGNKKKDHGLQHSGTSGSSVICQSCRGKGWY